MTDAVNPQIKLGDSVRPDNSEKAALPERTLKPDTWSSTVNDWLSSPMAFYPIILISAENLSDVKTSNKAALEHLEAALLLIKTLDQRSLPSIDKEIAMMSEVVREKRLFNEQYRRSAESLRETLRAGANLGQKDVLDQILTHLREALVHSEQIDYALCPLNNSEHLYSPDHGVMIDCILQNM
ncbi:hypothetical protein [uncultured Cohaesibacter sp.]|uniref:hypothetical protein n=1 Tax=uncultured Cohaesibacter sp. TaxID=1002546 RepID=UPI0029C865D6|nr:hypothetical protein [uncultured Cohaesibacter sp.]